MKARELGDFRVFYDTTQKRNYWLLGYFGGGAIEIHRAYDVAKDYAEENNVSVESVCIDEVQKSRRFKYFKYVYSTEKQKNVSSAYEMENVYSYLRD